ncbi:MULTISPECIES: DUF2142 domain-containing protein [unclassified Lentimicrobium]|uniref:DUF2142 domain-containing protein n=1 Tax=unclassified Lentimicrobium TaxID=2677434 RepID=UPI0015556B65|nr:MULTISPECIES: DUF2142 domain-containing protein [unclassified Lentimicrobium]NPD45552.1 DUF2142 domain-containing protein [Lentimicrobium sp. S6]NPD83631.1 DUF2142 domain-containing protein [Lentimicrobium sp. L6]
MTLQSLLNNISAQRIFLIASIIWGSIMVFLLPPFMVPDEPAHFYRSYQVSNLEFEAQVTDNRLGGEIPKGLIEFSQLIHETLLNGQKANQEFYQNALNIPLQKNKLVFVSFPNTSLYSPIAYLPQVIGISIGKIFDASPLVLLYLGRIFNLTFWIGIIYFALKIIPIYRWLFLLLALLPMSVNQAASLSADTFVNGLSFLFIAYIFRLAFDSEKYFKKKDYFSLLIIIILIAFAKNIYFFLLLLFYIIPRERFNSRREQNLFFIYLLIPTLITLAVNSLWVNHLLSLIHPIESFHGSAPEFPQINPAEQTKGILANIPGFILLVIKSFYHYFDMCSKSYIGILGWMNILLMNPFYIFAYVSIIVLAIFESSKDVVINIRQKTIMFLTFLGIIFIFSFTMYLSWCNVDDPMIGNLQGRYFIPIMPLFFFLLYNNRIRINHAIIKIGSIFFICASFTVSFFAILNFYYQY